MSTDKKNQRASKLTHTSPPPAHTNLFNICPHRAYFRSPMTIKQNGIQKRTKSLRYS